MDTHTCIFKTCSFKTIDFLSLLHFGFSRTNPHARFRSPLACRSFRKSVGPFTGDLIISWIKTLLQIQTCFIFSTFGNSARLAYSFLIFYI